MPILKGGVDGFSNFSFFSVILFSEKIYIYIESKWYMNSR